MMVFTDIAFRGPVIGSFLMCICAAVTGVFVFLKKRVLIGETLSHATYPGIVLGGFFCSMFNGMLHPFVLLGCAFLFSLIGYYILHFLEDTMKVDPDNALCFTLAFALGLGVLLTSQLQAESPLWHKRVQSYLYGQAVTLTDLHIYLYGLLALGVFSFVILRFREIELVTFDTLFAQSIGIRVQLIEYAIMVLLSISIVIGIRSVGVILMSGMLIAPAIAARQLTHSLGKMVGIAAVIGGISASIGTACTFYYPEWFPLQGNISLPPGPIIVLTASCLSIFTLIFAPSNGLFFRLYRSITFHLQCQSENLIKSIWKEAGNGVATLQVILSRHSLPKLLLRFLLWKLSQKALVIIDGLGGISLTRSGYKKAEHIVRLHRLWEVYLVNHLGVSAKRVHRSAEEIEHILTPELEKELLQFVGDSTHDPHKSPIPGQGGVL